MQPRPPSPVATALKDHHQHQGDDNEDERPHAPVAKALLNQTSSSSASAAQAMDEKPPGGSSSVILPNLLSSEKFPSSPHSPRGNKNPRTYFISPPTIVSSPVYNSSILSSPPNVPAAPPSTPYTPYNAAAVAGSSIPDLHPPLPLRLASISASPNIYSLNRRPSTPPLQYNNNSNNTTALSSPFGIPSPPPPTNNNPSSAINMDINRMHPPTMPSISPGTLLTAPLDPHYNALLNQALHETTTREKSRIDSLTRHETQNYTTVDEYRHALSRERRHSTTMALELARYKFSTRYTSCNIHSAAEINEEARINHLIKNIDTMKRDMNEDRCRVVMELEREEERIINGLVSRLEEVKREKMLLERQIGSVRGTATTSSGAGGAGVGAGMGMIDGEEQRLHAQFEQMMMDSEAAAAAGQLQQQGQHRPNIPQERVEFNRQASQCSDAVGEARSASPAMTGLELSIENQPENSEMEEDSEEDDNDEDILEGMHHDPEMEEELASLLKMKE